MLPQDLYNLVVNQPKNYEAIREMIAKVERESEKVREEQKKAKQQAQQGGIPWVQAIQPVQPIIELSDLVNYVHPVNRDTALHQACACGDVELISILLSVDADMELPNRDRQVPLELINPKAPNADEIRMLFEIYQHLKEESKRSKISLHRTLSLIEQVEEAVIGKEEDLRKPGVLFLGDTRKGKSVLINYLNKTDYQKQDLDRSQVRLGLNAGLVRVGGAEEIAPVGRMKISETFHPSVYSIQDHNYTLIDMPGVTDNRDYGGRSYEVAAAVGTKLLGKSLANIQGIVLVIEMADLVNHDIKNLSVPLYRIAELLAGINREHLQRILPRTILAFTKPDLAPQGFDKFTLADWLTGAMANFQAQPIDDPKKLYLRPIVLQILAYFCEPNNAAQCTVANIENATSIAGQLGVTRQNMHSRLERHTLLPDELPAEFLNFGNYHEVLRDFCILVKQLDNMRKAIIVQIASKEAEIAQIGKEVKPRKDEPNGLCSGIPTKNFVFIREKIKQIAKWQDKIAELRAEQRALEQRLAIANKICARIDKVRNIIDPDSIPPQFAAKAGLSSQTTSAIAGQNPNAIKSQMDRSVNQVDIHYYSDDEVTTLIRHYTKNKPNVDCLEAMLGTNWKGDQNTLRDNLAEYNLQRAENIANGQPVKDKILIPINLYGGHWVLLYVIYQNDIAKAPQIYYFDPMGNPPPQDLSLAISDVNVFSGIEITNIGQRVQNDGYNCGPWVVEATRGIIDSGAIPEHNYDIKGARAEHAHILNQQYPQVVNVSQNIHGHFHHAASSSDANSHHHLSHNPAL
jgi:hypothetical protein